MKNLAVVTPGFAADCLETLEEIAVENGDIFKANGGDEFRRHPVPQRQRAGHEAARPPGAPRIAGLGLTSRAEMARFRRINVSLTTNL